MWYVVLLEARGTRVLSEDALHRHPKAVLLARANTFTAANIIGRRIDIVLNEAALNRYTQYSCSPKKYALILSRGLVRCVSQRLVRRSHVVLYEHNFYSAAQNQLRFFATVFNVKNVWSLTIWNARIDLRKQRYEAVPRNRAR